MTINEARTLKNGDAVSWDGSDLVGRVFGADSKGFSVKWNDGGCSDASRFESPYCLKWFAKLSRVGPVRGPVEVPSDVCDSLAQEDPRFTQRNRIGALKVGDRVRSSSMSPSGGTVVAKSEHEIIFLWDMNLRRGDLRGSRWNLHNLNLAWDLVQFVDVPYDAELGSQTSSVTKSTLDEARRCAKSWEGTAVQHALNEQYYRDLLLQIAEVLGPDKFICDDGSIADEPLLAKIPELIHAAILGRLSEAVRNKLASAPIMVMEAPSQFVTGMKEVREDARQWPTTAELNQGAAGISTVVKFLNRSMKERAANQVV